MIKYPEEVLMDAIRKAVKIFESPKAHNKITDSDQGWLCWGMDEETLDDLKKLPGRGNK